MAFRAVPLGHGHRADWSRITHVRLRSGARADTDQGQRVLDHIRARADAEGVAAIAAIEPGFPARKRNLGALAGMRVDLRHMANEREAGGSALNKGLLELGWLEGEPTSGEPGPWQAETARTCAPRDEPVTADELSRVRRALLRLLDAIEGTRQSEGPARRIRHLTQTGAIPREVAALMVVVTEMRNASEYEAKQLSTREGRALRSAWEAIREWAAEAGYPVVEG